MCPDEYLLIKKTTGLPVVFDHEKMVQQNLKEQTFL